jgi:ferredoxin
MGVRACDLAALAIQDRHFLQGVDTDHHYARRRENTFIIAVNCSHPAATCFCAATGDGPNAGEGYDLVLDEIDNGFLIATGSEAGRTLLEALPTEAATPAQQKQVSKQRSRASQQQRSLPHTSLFGMLTSAAASSHWQAIAERCLACGNCTAVCPTCFCHSEHDVPQLDGSASEHIRQWDSCFNASHSVLHGFPVRAETAHRYRQWLTHKFDTWHQQYGRSGCVGCGRCISWCPVGIDVTEELQTLCGGGA